MTNVDAQQTPRVDFVDNERTPRVGVAVLACDPDGRLLLGRRGKHPNFGKWVIPGGGVRFGEDWARAGQREFLEETGLEVEIDRECRPLVLQLLAHNEHRIILFVRARVVGGELRPGSDLLDAQFFSQDNLPRNELSPAIEPVLKEFGW
jgi:8-oxo-dGTP diphosphatase